MWHSCTSYSCVYKTIADRILLNMFNSRDDSMIKPFSEWNGLLRVEINRFIYIKKNNWLNDDLKSHTYL